MISGNTTSEDLLPTPRKVKPHDGYVQLAFAEVFMRTASYIPAHRGARDEGRVSDYDSSRQTALLDDTGHFSHAQVPFAR